MSAKERYLHQLLAKNTKERWIAGVLLSAPAHILKAITANTIPFRYR